MAEDPHATAPLVRLVRSVVVGLLIVVGLVFLVVALAS